MELRLNPPSERHKVLSIIHPIFRSQFIIIKSRSSVHCVVFSDICCIISILLQTVNFVGRTFLYNPLMLFYAISFGLSRDKENKRLFGSSVINDIKENETTKETLWRLISKDKETGAR